MTMKLPIRRATRKEVRAAIAKQPNGEFFASWRDVKQKDVNELAHIIESATSEQPIQLFLQRKPALLIRHLGGGHGRWVIPQKRLGSEHVSDFLIGDAHSFGYEWFAVELESPKAKMFTKAGDASATLHHAIRQIQDWRIWLTHNLDYARRARVESGLGLKDVQPDLSGYIIIGRRCESRDDTNELRRQMMREHKIEIHTYDWLLDAANGRIDWFGTELGQRELHEKSTRRLKDD